jgi:hypothetical protein
MKTTLILFILACAACQAQTVHFIGGGGYSTFNQSWGNRRPAWTAGVVVERNVARHAGMVMGMSWRQRVDQTTTLYTIQFDLGGQYVANRLRAGGTLFFGMGAGTDTSEKIREQLKSGVGASAFVAWRIWRKVGLRLVYDHGLSNISSAAGYTVTPQAAYLLLQLPISE